MADAPERRKSSTRRKKRSPAREAASNVNAMMWEAVPLAVALGLSWCFDHVARLIQNGAGEEWGRTAHWLLLVVDIVACIQLVVPKTLVILNEIVALLMKIFETAALGMHRTTIAFRTGRPADEQE